MTANCCTYFNANIKMLLEVASGNLEGAATEVTCGERRTSVSTTTATQAEGSQLEDYETQVDDAWSSWAAGNEESAIIEEQTDEVDVALGPDVECAVMGLSIGTLPEYCCETFENVTSSFIEMLGEDGSVADNLGGESAQNTTTAFFDVIKSDKRLCGTCLEELTQPLDFILDMFFSRIVSLEARRKW
eukprot:CAMPEP_0118634834 /NCGR_PEP_ID=MMETSP0785-20121206/1758_1 /TAXON_ID=91992 /ORGANISM="Bolidomonas pacifica, Strain CCMP 1866" /LENGTH=187 /DNA_ID=CAMNT_0006525835 /DNA_START=188 /DNA_END=751 /DNA_ORIENTATION=-